MAASDSSDCSSVSAITSLEHVVLFTSSFKNAAKTCNDHQLIDFLSSIDKYSGNKEDIDQEADHEHGLGRRNLEISISTELSLCFGPPVMSKKRKMAAVPIDDDDNDIDLRIALPVNLNHEEWEIKKTLKRSDVDGSSRLLLGKELVRKHILPHLQGVDVSEAEGVEVAVWDADTRTKHVLVVKLWSSGSFVMTRNWMSGFVKRRGLRENDEIGLRWDDENSRLEFTAFNGVRNQ